MGWPWQRKDTVFSSYTDFDVGHKGAEYATTSSLQLANRRLNYRIVVDLPLERAHCLIEGGILLQGFLSCEFHVLKQRSHCFSVDHRVFIPPKLTAHKFQLWFKKMSNQVSEASYERPNRI